MKELTEYAWLLHESMEQTHEYARENLKASNDRQKKYYDHRTQLKIYQVGKLVWYYYPQKVRGRSHKMMGVWDGLYKVQDRLIDVLYRIQKSPNSLARVVHVNKLKPYHGDIGKSTGMVSNSGLSLSNLKGN